MLIDLHFEDAEQNLKEFDIWLAAKDDIFLESDISEELSKKSL